MNCKRAQLEIALWVGNDLDGSAVEGLQQHLSECSPCRRHWERLKASLKRLKDPVVSGARSMHDSVWPDLISRLPSRSAEPQPVEFNGWLPALAVIAASVAIAAFWQNEPLDRSTAVAVESPASRVGGSDVAPVVVRVGMPIFGARKRNPSESVVLSAVRDRATFEKASLVSLLFPSIGVSDGAAPSRAEFGDSSHRRDFERRAGIDAEANFPPVD